MCNCKPILLEEIMFKNITIRNGKPNLGLIAENLLFYNRVNIIIDNHFLPNFIQEIGIDTLIELIEYHNLHLFIRENILAVSRRDNITHNAHDVVLIDPPLNKEGLILRAMEETGRKGYARRITNRLVPLVKGLNYDPKFTNEIREDFMNKEFMRKSISQIINNISNEINLSPSQIEYDFKLTNGGYYFQTNLNYEKINDQIKGKGIIEPDTIMSEIIESRSDMYFASEFNSEIATKKISAQLMKSRFDIVQKSQKSSENIFAFNDFTLDGKNIQSIINSGEKSMKDFIPILQKSEKFKNWLYEIESDKNIIKEYHTAVTKESWADKLPNKAYKWSFFTVLSAVIDAQIKANVALPMTLGLSLGDTFLVDKLFRGWKPNIFIENEIKPFVE